MANKTCQTQSKTSSSAHPHFQQFAPVQAKPDKVPLPQDQPEQEVEIDEDDLGFVDEFQSNLGFLESLNAKQLNRCLSRLL